MVKLLMMIIGITILLSCYYLFLIFSTEHFQNLPSAARDILIPALDEAVHALSGKVNASEADATAETVILSKYYFMNKKDPDTGSKVNGFYVIDGTKFTNLSTDYQNANNMMSDIFRDFPVTFQKIISK